MPSMTPSPTQRKTRCILQNPCNLNVFKRHTTANNLHPAPEPQATALGHINHGLLDRLASKMDRLETLKD